MKKRGFITVIAALLALLLLLAGCGTGNGSETAKATAGSDNTATAAPTDEKTDATHPPAKENVAKIILILGQSNAVGATQFAPMKDVLGEEKFNALKREGYDNVRIVYYAGEANATNYYEKKLDTITVEKLFDKVRFGKSLTAAMFGLEMGIAEYLTNAHPDETYYIIKVARGGESLKPKFAEGGVLFEKAISMCEGCFGVLEREGYTPEICAICWMQGENEAGLASTAETYGKSLAELAGALRRRLAAYAPWGGIPFIDGGISSYWNFHEVINAQKAAFAETSPINYFIDSIALGVTYDKEPADNPDLAHFDSESVWLLGQEFGKYIDLAYEKVK